MSEELQQSASEAIDASVVFSEDWTSEGVAAELRSAEIAIEEPKIADPGKAVGTDVKALAQSSGYYLAGTVGTMLVGLVSFPIFTRVFSVAEYGIIDLSSRLLLLLTITSKLGFQNAALRFYDHKHFRENRIAELKYYSTMFFGMLSTSALVVLASLAVLWLAPNSLMDERVARLIYLIIALVVLRAIGSVLWAFLRIEERTKLFNLLSVGVRALTVVGVCALLPIMGRTASTFFGGTVAVELVLVVALSAWLWKRGVLGTHWFDGSLFKTGIAFGMPLVAYEFAFALLGSSDRFLIRYFLGPDSLGFYSVASGLARNANDFLLSPLSLAILPIYMRIWNTDGKEKTTAFLTTAFDGFILASLGMLAAVTACAHEVVVLLASAKYDGADRYVPVLLAGLIVYAAHLFVAAGLLIHKKTLKMASILVLSAITNIALNVVLLPRIGLMGGAVATLLSYSLCIILLARASSKFLPLHLQLSSLIRYGAAAVLAWMIGSRLTFGVVAIDLFLKSMVTFAIYATLLYVLDRRARERTNLALAWCKERLPW